MQDLGEELTRLSPAAQKQLELPQELREALALYARLRDREGRRRQMQYIGRLMREMDVEPLRAALAARKEVSAAATDRFHRIEQWRDRLLGSSGRGAGRVAGRLDPQQGAHGNPGRGARNTRGAHNAHAGGSARPDSGSASRAGRTPGPARFPRPVQGLVPPLCSGLIVLSALVVRTCCRGGHAGIAPGGEVRRLWESGRTRPAGTFGRCPRTPRAHGRARKEGGGRLEGFFRIPLCPCRPAVRLRLKSQSPCLHGQASCSLPAASFLSFQTLLLPARPSEKRTPGSRFSGDRREEIGTEAGKGILRGNSLYAGAVRKSRLRNRRDCCGMNPKRIDEETLRPGMTGKRVRRASP